MKFKNAYVGIGRLYVAVVLGIIIMAITALFSIIGGITGTGEDSPMYALFGMLGIVLLIGGILLLILEMAGTHRAGKDEKAFNNAFKCILLNILLSIIVSFIKKQAIINVFTVLTTLLDLGTIWFILTGIVKIFKELNNDEMVKKAKMTRLIYLAAFALELICVIVGILLTGKENMDMIKGIIDGLASIAEVVGFVLLFLCLKKARPLLKAANDAPAEEAPAAEQAVEEAQEENPQE